MFTITKKKSRISFIFFVPDKKMTPKSTKKLKPPEYFFPSTKKRNIKKLFNAFQGSLGHSKCPPIQKPFENHGVFLKRKDIKHV